MIKSVATLTLSVLFLSACSTNSANEGHSDYSRVFKAPYEVVWRATQQALLNYPMNINNMDTGQLQTLYITGQHRYRPPHESKNELPSGFQYRLNVNIIKGEKSSKVIISKEARLQKDFFSEPEDQPSDGYEEKALLYRIKREIVIENLLKKQAPTPAQPGAAPATPSPYPSSLPYPAPMGSPPPPPL